MSNFYWWHTYFVVKLFPYTQWGSFQTQMKVPGNTLHKFSWRCFYLEALRMLLVPVSGRQSVSGIGVFPASVILSKVKDGFGRKRDFLVFCFSVWTQQTVGDIRCAGLGISGRNHQKAQHWIANGRTFDSLLLADRSHPILASSGTNFPPVRSLKYITNQIHHLTNLHFTIAPVPLPWFPSSLKIKSKGFARPSTFSDAISSYCPRGHAGLAIPTSLVFLGYREHASGSGALHGLLSLSGILFPKCVVFLLVT